MITEQELVLWVVDAQNDFFDRPYDGGQPALAVPGAVDIADNLGKVVQYAWKQPGWYVSGTVDAHDDDPLHFAKWPKHCVKGTPGQLHIAETRLQYAVFVPVESGAYVGDLTEPVFFEKKERSYHTEPDESTSPKCNDNIKPYLERIKPRAIVIAGVVLGFCVKEAVEYFLEMNYAVAVVQDAIKEFAPEELQLYTEWERRGVLLTSTEEVVSEALEAKL